MPVPSRVRTRLNVEFDSRVLRVSSGAAGITRPQLLTAKREQVFCLNCGRPGGIVGSTDGTLPPALRGNPGVIYVCLECDGKLGPMPTDASSFMRYKES